MSAAVVKRRTRNACHPAGDTTTNRHGALNFSTTDRHALLSISATVSRSSATALSVDPRVPMLDPAQFPVIEERPKTRIIPEPSGDRCTGLEAENLKLRVSCVDRSELEICIEYVYPPLKEHDLN